jgi:hypothetical protein
VTTRRGWSRRRFLRVSGSLAALAAAGVAVGPRSPVNASARLASLVPSRESARAVGREYLAARTDRPGADLLVAELRRGVPSLDRLVASGSDGELRAATDAAVRRDFAIEDVVHVRGWILSKTEARLCGLTALADESPLPPSPDHKR